MRISYRLLLIASVAACAPIMPAPQSVIPSITPAAPTPAAPATSSQATTPPPAAYDEVGFEGWKQSFIARKGGSRQAEYARELADVQPDPTVVRLDRNQPEFSRPPGAYIQNAVTPVRIAQAKQRVDRVPWSVVQRFGVPSEILVGIWAQESAFGQVQGNYDVITSLATLAYDGRRREWAEDQLKHAIDIVIDGRRPREGLKGSWAGAMGQPQFMPDNYLRLGVDQDGDGHVDIWGDETDALASAANLLSRAGWKRGQNWGYEVVLPAGFDYSQAEGPKEPWSYWAQRGVRLTQGGTPNQAEQNEDATILLPQGANGPAFLVLPNHYVIRAYNNSVSYALAIGLTADGIAGKPALSKTWPNDPAMTREQRIGAQSALTQFGYDTQGIDGVIGSNTRAALRRWQVANGRLADGYLTSDLADELIRKAR